MSGDLACTYAALILSEDGQEVTADKMATLIKGAGVEIEPYWTMVFAKFLATKSVDELVANVGAGKSTTTPLPS
jgi:large subunit ribosomal protein LP1